MRCACQTGSRQLRLHFECVENSLIEDLSQLPFWSRWADRVWSVEVGGNSNYRTPDDIANFLGIFLSDELLDDIECQWESGTEPVCCQIGRSQSCRDNGNAMKLIDFAAQTSSPLLDLLKSSRIYSHFQPVFARDATTIWGYECLMRANDLTGGSLSPAQILEWARAENLLSMLDRVCRETHLENASKTLPRGRKILINFMPTAIYEPAFCLRSTQRVIDRLNLNPADIVFEVVESEEVKDEEHLRRILDYYRQAGFMTALDDFGAGSSGLGLLASLSPDLIKIDRNLVARAALHKNHTAVVRGLVQIARECGQLILAEGIESEQELKVMQELGVDLFQGFYLARPSAHPPLSNSGIRPTKTSQLTH